MGSVGGEKTLISWETGNVPAIPFRFPVIPLVSTRNQGTFNSLLPYIRLTLLTRLLPDYFIKHLIFKIESLMSKKKEWILENGSVLYINDMV